MIINITEYLANSLLTIFSMDLNYFETQIPVTSDIVNIMICFGWALMLGNLVFQGIKSMATGLGFEGEDPQMLFTRTFVMSFFLLCSRQICDIGLGIAKKVIALLEIPTIVQVPKLSETVFSVPGDASWLLVIIIGIVLVIQIIKLFFEIGERYVIVAILTILSPLAFSMGGSKSTEDIFKGWVRMFASMCIMMVLSVVFLKLILSAMSVVPSGVAVVPWAVFVVALAKANKKIDGLLARIGLNPAVTGDSLGFSRAPGMLTYMVAKNLASSIGKTTMNHSAGGGRGMGIERSASSSGTGSQKSTPVRPPIGSNGNPSSGTDSKGNPSTVAQSATETHKDSSYSASSPSGMDSTKSSTDISAPPINQEHGTRPEKESFSTQEKTASVLSGNKKQADLSTPQTTKGVDALNAVPLTAPNMDKNDRSVSDRNTAHDKAFGGISITPKSSADIKTLGSSSGGSEKERSTQAPRANTPIANKPSADIKMAPTANGGMVSQGTPKTDISSSSKMSNDRTRSPMSSVAKGGFIVSRGEYVKAATVQSIPSGRLSQDLSNKNRADMKSSHSLSPSSQSMINQSGDGTSTGDAVSQNQSNTTNVSMQQKNISSHSNRPDVTTARGGIHKPPTGNMPNNTSKINEQIAFKQATPDASKDTSPNFHESIQSVLNKGSKIQNADGSPMKSYNNTTHRPENNSPQNGEAIRKVPTESPTTSASSTANIHVTPNIVGAVPPSNISGVTSLPQAQMPPSRPVITNSSQLQNIQSINKAPHRNDQQEHTSRERGSVDKVNLKNHPSKKASNKEKPDKKKGGGMNEQ